jgi:glutamyl-tRNA synthetase
VYPGFCRDRPWGWGEEEGRLPSWRLRLPAGRLSWLERVAAPHGLDAAEVGDVVLRRADGFLAYHLATAVDELSLGIADVVRGEDLWAATAPQVAVMRELGGEPPRYWHLPLSLDAEGRRLSKREGGLSLDALQQQGMDQAAVVGWMAAQLRLVAPGARLSSRELLEELDLAALHERLAPRT